MRLVLAVVVLAQLLACQALTATPASVTAVAVQDVGHGTGHDPVCEAAQTVATTTSATRLVAPDCLAAPGSPAVLVALVAAALVLASRTGSGGMPFWAPQRLLPGRHRLLAVGIVRV